HPANVGLCDLERSASKQTGPRAIHLQFRLRWDAHDKQRLRADHQVERHSSCPPVKVVPVRVYLANGCPRHSAPSVWGARSVGDGAEYCGSTYGFSVNTATQELDLIVRLSPGAARRYMNRWIRRGPPIPGDFRLAIAVGSIVDEFPSNRP